MLENAKRSIRVASVVRSYGMIIVSVHCLRGNVNVMRCKAKRSDTSLINNALKTSARLQ